MLITLALWIGVGFITGSARAAVPDSTVTWEYHAPRFRPLFDGFALERESAPVASFAFGPRAHDSCRVFRVKTRPSALRPGLSAELTFDDDREGLVLRETRLGTRDLAEYLYLSVLVLILDRTPVPARVLVNLPWHDPERRAVFNHSAGEWRAGWMSSDLGRALAHFGYAFSSVDERGGATFRMDPCGVLLTIGR